MLVASKNIKASLNQIALGNFTEDVTLLGTVGSVALGFLVVDFPLDVRDGIADVVKWEWTWSHVGQTAFDVIASAPAIGAIKYTDEVVLLIKNGDKVYTTTKKAGEVAGLVKHADEVADVGKHVAQYGDDFGKMGVYIKNPEIKVDWTLNIEHASSRMELRGLTKEKVDSIVDTGKALSQNQNAFVDYKELAQKINMVFERTLTTDLFKKDISECEKIAHKILDV